MIGRPTHVQEERLLDCYLAERSDEPLDPRVVEHLNECRPCALRYEDLTRFMDGLRDEADAETDALFTPEHLAAQQRHIARAIEHVGRAARVITFPVQAEGRPVDVSYRRMTPRWVAAAVAAGVVMGLGLGASFRWERRAGTPQLTAAARPAPPTRLAPVATGGIGAVVTADDDAFLTDLEIALESPRTRELQPFDAITPHVREITSVR